MPNWRSIFTNHHNNISLIKNIRQCTHVAFGSGFTNNANTDEVGALIISLVTCMFFLFWLQTSILDLNFIFNSNLMNEKRYPFWLRFIFFFMVFSVAFFLMIFLVDRSPGHDLKMLLIKIGILAPVSSFFYNILIESDPQTVDWRTFISSCSKH